MDIGKLHTPHDPFGCLYYFAVDEQSPDAPRRETTRYYYVLATPSSSCSDALLFLCRSLCPPDHPRGRLQQWYTVYQTFFARLAFEAFVGLVRESAFWDRLTQTRKAPGHAALHDGCLQLFTDESTARAGLARHRQALLERHSGTEEEGRTTTGENGRLDSAAVPPQSRSRPTNHSARPPSSATPEKNARDVSATSPPPPPALGSSITAVAAAPSSASARTALPFSARQPPLGIPTHHFDSLDDSNPTVPSNVPPSASLPAKHGALVRSSTNVIELSQVVSSHPGRRGRRADDRPQDEDSVDVNSAVSSIRLADQLSAVASWPAESAAVTLRGRAENSTHATREAESYERLYRQLQAVRQASRTPGEQGSRHHGRGHSRSSSVSSVSSSSNASEQRRRRHRTRPSSRPSREGRRASDVHRTELVTVQATLTATAAALSQAQQQHALQERQWREEVSALRNEVHAASLHASARLHELVQENQKEVARLEANFAAKEAEIRHVYGLALQNRDVRLVQLSEELAVTQQRERASAGRESSQKAELAQARHHLHEAVEENNRLQAQLRDLRSAHQQELRAVRPITPASAPERQRGDAYAGDDLLEALRGAEQRYTASVLYAKKLETEVDHVRTLLAERDGELAKTYALVQALQDGLRTVKLELPVLREEWQREFTRAVQTSEASASVGATTRS